MLEHKDKWIPQVQPTDAQPHRSGPSSSGYMSSLVNEDENSSVCPVIRYSSFEERVKSFNPLATSDFIRVAGNYLQDMGEVSSFAFVSYGILILYMNYEK